MNDSNDGPRAALSKTSCPQQSRPLLVSWNARALYLGPALHLAAHRNAVAVLAIGLDGPLGVALDPANPALGLLNCRTALIEPNQLHLLAMQGEQYAFLYVDALSKDLMSLRGRCRRRVGMVGFDLDNEDALIALLAGMDRSADGWDATRDLLAALLSLYPAGSDGRIRQAAGMLLASPADETDAAGHARKAGLSSSRFQHLFKEQTGVSFRRFRLWARLQATMSHVLDARTLTQAAHEAGFSSSAHLSSAFKAMFGLPLTTLLAGNILFVRSRQE
ncbi:helix-turn-helix domain-containing protein [Massilia frigida]|uniref:helix-turn-helix domain-containing protein n=1 Tax=Massilia frigida TaxID=2609281 RepID=UPI0014247D89